MPAFNLNRVFVPLSMTILAGCAGLPQENAAGYEATPPEAMTRPVASNGAIYQSGYDMVLYEDLRARRIGDIIQVLLVEKTDAAKSSKTEIDKDSSNSLADPSFLGRTATISGNGLGLSIDSENEFEGEGKSNQSNKLSGSIAVTVAGVLPNGNLQVQGEKWIQLNQGKEFIRLRGIVRPYDVSPNNTVLSTQVADARISYGGTGALNEANTSGWLVRFFMSPIWPF